VFAVGGTRDIGRMFKRLRETPVDHRDDGRVPRAAEAPRDVAEVAANLANDEAPRSDAPPAAAAEKGLLISGT
jgi:hypothetical protein